LSCSERIENVWGKLLWGAPPPPPPNPPPFMKVTLGPPLSLGILNSYKS